MIVIKLWLDLHRKLIESSPKYFLIPACSLQLTERKIRVFQQVKLDKRKL